MNGIDSSANGPIQPAAPIFASSWMALYVQLRQELDTIRGQHRAVGEDDHSKDAHHLN